MTKRIPTSTLQLRPFTLKIQIQVYLEIVELWQFFPTCSIGDTGTSPLNPTGGTAGCPLTSLRWTIAFTRGMTSLSLYGPLTQSMSPMFLLPTIGDSTEKKTRLETGFGT